MPEFHYKARHKESHKLVKGKIEANEEIEAIKKLRAKKLLVLSIENPNQQKITLRFLQRVTTSDRVLFARQFAVMMRAGLPIVPALQAIEDQTTNPLLRQALQKMKTEIENGMALSQALSQHPAVFPGIFVSVAKIGEKSGKLEQVLEQLAQQLEKDEESSSKIKSAMVYPVFILLALIAVMTLIIVYIVPQLKGIFDEIEVPLPLITRILLGISNVVSRYFIPLALAGLAIIGLFIFSYRRWPQFRLQAERLLFKIPVFGKLYQKIVISRLNHTLSTLLTSGLPLLDAIKTTNEAMRSPNYSQSLTALAESVESGKSLSEGILNDKLFPSMMGHMAAIGESSGTIDQILNTLANFYDREIDNLVRNLSALIEPILMLLMGIGVAFVVASVIVPIYNLVTAV